MESRFTYTTGGCDVHDASRHVRVPFIDYSIICVEMKRPVNVTVPYVLYNISGGDVNLPNFLCRVHLNEGRAARFGLRSLCLHMNWALRYPRVKECVSNVEPRSVRGLQACSGPAALMKL